MHPFVAPLIQVDSLWIARRIQNKDERNSHDKAEGRQGFMALT